MSAVLTLSKNAVKRRAFIEDTIPSPSSILEIGAFDNPIFRREMGDDVKYVDWFSRDELVAMHKNNPRRDPDRIVDIDFVVKSSRLAENIPERFELVCASHVIEHVADVVRWLYEIASLLSENGRVFLAIPDRRYTFDYFRNTSTAAQMLRAYDEKLKIPSKWQLVDHFYYHQKVDLKAIWNAEPMPEFRPRFGMDHAIELADRKAKTYTDCHCWTFTSDTFRQVLADLASAGLSPFEIERAADPLPNTSEFHVLLRKTP